MMFMIYKHDDMLYVNFYFAQERNHERGGQVAGGEGDKIGK